MIQASLIPRGTFARQFLCVANFSVSPPILDPHVLPAIVPAQRVPTAQEDQKRVSLDVCQLTFAHLTPPYPPLI